MFVCRVDAQRASLDGHAGSMSFICMSCRQPVAGRVCGSHFMTHTCDPQNTVKELSNGDELSLGVASASVAKKTKSLADSFIAFIYKSADEAQEQDEVCEACSHRVLRGGVTEETPHTQTHAAFLDPDGPIKEFECGRVLGSGAFAEGARTVTTCGADAVSLTLAHTVRLCIERSTGTKYAAKIIDKQKFAMNKELRSGSYRDEINILKSIQHPYIVGVKDIFETTRYLVIILQFVDGGDLFDLLVRRPAGTCRVFLFLSS